MDLPAKLTNNPKWVFNKEEIRQKVLLILENHAGEFIQSPMIGRRFDIHQQDDITLDEGVRASIEQIEEVRLVSVKIERPLITIWIEYKEDRLEIEFNLDEV